MGNSLNINDFEGHVISSIKSVKQGKFVVGYEIFFVYDGIVQFNIDNELYYGYHYEIYNNSYFVDENEKLISSNESIFIKKIIDEKQFCKNQYYTIIDLNNKSYRLFLHKIDKASS